MLWLAMVWLPAAPEAVCERVRLVAEVGSDGRTVVGEATCINARKAPHVALYPNLFVTPDGIDDLNAAWFYPDGFDPAGIEIAVDGQVISTAAVWQPLPTSGVGADIRVGFRTRVPRRNGTFGKTRDALYLLGGWHPAFGDGEDIRPCPIDYDVRVSPGLAGFVGAQPLGQRSVRVVRGTYWGRYLPIFLSPTPFVRILDSAMVLAPAPVAAFQELQDTLTTGEAAAVAANLVADRLPLRVVIAPLREHLVEAFDGGFAVSDRAFAVLGFERFLKFHRLSIWRAQLAARALPFCAQHAEPFSPELCADALATALLDPLTLELYGGKEFAPDLLESFAVIPEIDTLIFAPQVSFVTSYFEAVDESPKRRWRLDDFYHAQPRGKLLVEKLVDRYGAARTYAALALSPRLGESPWRVLARQLSVDVDAVLTPWLGPYPRLNYRLANVTSGASKTTVTIAVDANGAIPEEPITVAATDVNGQRHEVTRLGPGDVTLAVPGPLRVVELDPHGRVVELLALEGIGPRFDNREPQRWRFLLNNITSLIAVTNREFTAAADFSLRRIHDLRYRADFFMLYSPSSTGLASTLSVGFGQPVTPLVLAERLGLSLAYERLRADRDGAVPGDQLSTQLFYRYDDRQSPYWSFSGHGYSARLAWGLGQDRDGTRHSFAQAGVSGLGILPLTLHQALVGRLRADFTWGDAPAQNGLRLGDRYRAARGYERDEAKSTRRVVASGEYRHVLDAHADTDFWGLATWSRFEGALFADAVYLPVKRLGCEQSMFYDVGYGLRWIVDVFGVSPAEFAVDMGVPLNRCADEQDRIPIAVYIAFDQSFSVF